MFYEINKLDFSNKGLTTIPFEIFLQKDTTKLILRDNKISYIPKEISELKKLQLLDLSNNRIKVLNGSLFKLYNLKTLILSNNQIKQIPKLIGNLKKLRILILANNILSELPPELVHLNSLERLSIANNQFTNLPKEILKLTSLKRIWLNSNKIDYKYIEQLKLLPKLKAVYCYKIATPRINQYKGNALRSKINLNKAFSLQSKENPLENMDQIAKTDIFISYAHSDKDWIKRVKNSILVLKYESLKIDVWDDSRILAGQNWKEEISKALSKSRIAILLISTDFLISEFIRNSELPILLKNASEKGTIILSLILSPCRFSKNKELSIFQAVNDPNNPLSGMSKHEQELTLLQLTEAVETHISMVE